MLTHILFEGSEDEKIDCTFVRYLFSIAISFCLSNPVLGSDIISQQLKTLPIPS